MNYLAKINKVFAIKIKMINKYFKNKEDFNLFLKLFAQYFRKVIAKRIFSVIRYIQSSY